MDSSRVWPALAALAAVVALAGLLAYVSTAVNRPPVILTWEAQPVHVARNASATLRVAAADPDGGTLRYEFRADRGRVAGDAALPTAARYTPPADGGSFDRVTVTVTDPHGLSVTATTSVTIEAAARAASAGEAPPVPEPTAGASLEPADVPPAPVPPAVAPPAVAGAASASARDVAERTAPTRDRPEASSPASMPPVAAAASLPPAPAPAPSVGAAAPPAASAPRAGDARESPSEPADAPSTNHPPVLDKGSKIEGLGARSVLLVANGYDPDGDPIEFEWDTKGCFEVISQSQSQAEVKFGYCTWGVIRLTWKDPHGASAHADWTISK